MLVEVLGRHSLSPANSSQPVAHAYTPAILTSKHAITPQITTSYMYTYAIESSGEINGLQVNQIPVNRENNSQTSTYTQSAASKLAAACNVA